MAKETKGNKNVEEGKLCAFLSYLLVGIIWYFADEKMKKNDFVKFHVKQGLVLLITSLIINVAGTVTPFIGPWVIMPLGGLFTLIMLIIGIVNALNGQEKDLPIIGIFAKKFTF